MMKKLYSTPEIELIKFRLTADVLNPSTENGGSIIEDDLNPGDDELDGLS